MTSLRSKIHMDAIHMDQIHTVQIRMMKTMIKTCPPTIQISITEEIKTDNSI